MSVDRFFAALAPYRRSDNHFHLGQARFRVHRYHHRHAPKACVYLRELYVPPRARRHGHGAAAFKLLLGLADRHRVAIVLHVHSFGTRVARSMLIKWYSRLGFVPIDLGYANDYIRSPCALFL